MVTPANILEMITSPQANYFSKDFGLIRLQYPEKPLLPSALILRQLGKATAAKLE